MLNDQFVCDCYIDEHNASMRIRESIINNDNLANNIVEKQNNQDLFIHGHHFSTLSHHQDRAHCLAYRAGIRVFIGFMVQCINILVEENGHATIGTLGIMYENRGNYRKIHLHMFIA
jgi:hypothetical protein